MKLRAKGTFFGGGGFRCHLSREREYPRRAASLAGSGGIPGICSGLVSVGAVKSALFRVSTKAPVERRRACVAFHDRNVAKNQTDGQTDGLARHMTPRSGNG